MFKLIGDRRDKLVRFAFNCLVIEIILPTNYDKQLLINKLFDIWTNTNRVMIKVFKNIINYDIGMLYFIHDKIFRVVSLYMWIVACK